MAKAKAGAIMAAEDRGLLRQYAGAIMADMAAGSSAAHIAPLGDDQLEFKGTLHLLISLILPIISSTSAPPSQRRGLIFSMVKTHASAYT